MNCQRVQKALSDYSDGLLTPTKTEEIREHLVSCVPCRARCQSFQNMLSGLHTLPPIAPSTDFDLRLQRRLHEISAERSPRKHSNWLTPLYRVLIPSMVGLVLLISAAAYLSYHPQQLTLPSVANSVRLDPEENPHRVMEQPGQTQSQPLLADFLSSQDVQPSESTNYVLYTVSYDNNGALVGF